MITLATLKNSTRPRKNVKRVGRGIGSGKGKTCGRGEKGAGSRSGYKRRYGYEGGQFRTFMKMPIRGFNNARFAKKLDSINLSQIEAVFEEGEVVNVESLKKRGFISGTTHGIKILGNGDLKKKVKIEAHAISDGAREKLQKHNIQFAIIE
jgi:large subunit ribosomal protein L15